MSINRGVVLQADIFKNLGQLNSTIVVAVCSMVQRVLVVLQFDGLPCFFYSTVYFRPSWLGASTKMISEMVLATTHNF